MKLRLLSPFIFLSVMIISISIACNLSPAVPPTQSPVVPTQVVPPTQASVTPTQVVPTTNNPPAFPTQISNPPTSIPPTPIPPTVTPLSEFFTETFQGDLSVWPYDIFLGDKDKFSESQSTGGLRIQLDDPELYVYYYYTPVTYQDVRLDLTFTNMAHNSNNINLVCRNSAAGRYEFTVQNDGLYQIWAYDGKGGNGYVILADGGSTAIRSGQQRNEITATCVGNTFTLYINGSKVREAKDNKFFLPEGQIGFGANISPTNPVTPVIVEFESLTISQP
jgi:hypothetical protein